MHIVTEYSTDQVAKTLGIDKSTLLRWLYSGRLAEPKIVEIANLEDSGLERKGPDASSALQRHELPEGARSQSENGLKPERAVPVLVHRHDANQDA